MNINNSPVPSTNATDFYQSNETQGAQQATRAAAAGASAGATSTGAASSSHDDVHLSELVRSLRSLASDSPERQNKIEQLTRSYANGSYQVDAQATAQGIINETTKH